MAWEIKRLYRDKK